MNTGFGTFSEWVGLIGGIAGLVGGAAGLWAVHITHRQARQQEADRAFATAAEAWCQKKRDAMLPRGRVAQSVEDAERPFAEWGIRNGFFEAAPGTIPGVLFVRNR